MEPLTKMEITANLNEALYGSPRAAPHSSLSVAMPGVVKHKDPLMLHFVEAVKRNRCLYDKNDPLYGDNCHKAKVWQMIANQIGFKGRPSSWFAHKFPSEESAGLGEQAPLFSLGLSIHSRRSRKAVNALEIAANYPQNGEKAP